MTAGLNWTRFLSLYPCFWLKGVFWSSFCWPVHVHVWHVVSVSISSPKRSTIWRKKIQLQQNLTNQRSPWCVFTVILLKMNTGFFDDSSPPHMRIVIHAEGVYRTEPCSCISWAKLMSESTLNIKCRWHQDLTCPHCTLRQNCQTSALWWNSSMCDCD